MNTLDNQEEVGHSVAQIQSPMDPRIQEFLARRLYEDTRKRVFYSSLSFMFFLINVTFTKERNVYKCK